MTVAALSIGYMLAAAVLGWRYSAMRNRFADDCEVFKARNTWLRTRLEDEEREHGITRRALQGALAANSEHRERAQELQELVALHEEFTLRAEQYVGETVDLFEEFARRVGNVRELITDPVAEKVWNDIYTDPRLADIKPHLMTVRHTIVAAATHLPLPTIEPPTFESVELPEEQLEGA